MEVAADVGTPADSLECKQTPLARICVVKRVQGWMGWWQPAGGCNGTGVLP